MKTSYTEDRIRPFRLVKYFTFSSLIVILLGAVVLSFLNTYWARRMLLQKNEEYAQLLIANLNHQVYLQFLIPAAIKYRGNIRLSDKDQSERMDIVVRSALHGFEVDLVNIYDMENVLAYSYDVSLVGKKNIGGAGYHKALAGRSTSRLAQRGNFLAILLGIPKESRLITFSPLRAEQAISRISDPEIYGVVEIVQDLSEDYEAVFNVQILVIISSTLVMGLLFLVLRFVVKRGEEIIERRAQERLELKEQLNRAERLSSLGEMVASISHEIRNPLGIIRSSAELLKKKMSKLDAGNKIPEIIVEEAVRLNDIITDFLNFARPRIPNLTPCRVDNIVGKNISFLTPQIEVQGYAIQTYFQDNIPEIMADTDMLYQAFLNILINAMQAMPTGGNIFIYIRVANDKVMILFEDTGDGISSEILEKIWDPFFTTKDKGTGLGLGIVRNIIEQHGGIIQIHNREDGGARVTLELPLGQGE
jgi:two-component system sensor histidine kinase HydH